jgi:4-hydroxy-tetrahydrodipicolinate synthase
MPDPTKSHALRGVIAASPTIFDASGAPDHDRTVALARFLLDNGCDALNVLGTTGEATSLSVAERIAVMRAIATALPRSRLMAGTGAASVTDAVELTKAAAELGFAGALLLPPFYYKGVPAAGIVAYLKQVAQATAPTGIPLYLYNFPAQTGIAYTPEIIAMAIAALGSRVAGIKDSSGDLPYCRTVARMSEALSVFPATEGALMEAREGLLSGCISASANLNSDLCARAFHRGDSEAAERAVNLRKLVAGPAIVSSVKALLSVMRDDSAIARVRAPLQPLSQHEALALARKAAEVRKGAA